MQARRHHAPAFGAFGPISLAILIATWPSISRGRGRGAELRPEAVIARAQAAELWTDEAWLRLLHYRPTPFGGLESDVEGARFFLSKKGQTDPRAELEATLRAFYQPPFRVAGLADGHARCRFPARFHWLDQKLGLSAELPAMRCPKLERYRAFMAPDSVALFYASNSVERPVSAFGHTFLVLKQSRLRPEEQWVVEFTAETDTDNPLLYAFKGIFGMFPGSFQYRKLSEKLEKYLGEQDRDLWEYELALKRDELEQLTRHLWELSSTSLNYYYASKNCSYGLLTLLEAAAPRLELIDNTKYVVLPVDTVKALFLTPGLVRSVRHRPAHPGASPPHVKSPHLGHGTMRVLLGTGFTSQYDDGFATLGYRIALHDLADPAQGEPELSQVLFMDLRMRYEALRQRLTLNELTFAELTTLHSLTRGPGVSWRVRGYGLRLHDAGCENEDCFAHGANGSLGVSLASSNEQVAVFAMADAYVLFSGAFDGVGGSFVRVGTGPYAGIRLRAPDPLVTVLSGSWSYLPGQDLKSTYELRGAVRLALDTDVALGFEGLVQPSAIEGQFNSYVYF